MRTELSGAPAGYGGEGVPITTCAFVPLPNTPRTLPGRTAQKRSIDVTLPPAAPRHCQRWIAPRARQSCEIAQVPSSSVAAAGRARPRWRTPACYDSWFKPLRELHTVAEDLVIHGARTHNLKNVDVSLPVGKLIIITGVSGS